MSALSAGISIREFARREGCNDKLVRRAIQGGFLSAGGDGKLDPRLVGTGWRKTNRRADKPRRAADKGADMSAEVLEDCDVAAVVAEIAGLTADDVADEGNEDFDAGGDMIARLLSGKVFDLAQADRIKANALALKHVLAVRRTAGELIEAEVAERVLFDEARRYRDAWDNWPSRVGPLIAADLDLPVDTVLEALKVHVHRQLEELGQPSGDFSGGAA